MAKIGLSLNLTEKERKVADEALSFIAIALSEDRGDAELSSARQANLRGGLRSFQELQRAALFPDACPVRRGQ